MSETVCMHRCMHACAPRTRGPWVGRACAGRCQSASWHHHHQAQRACTQPTTRPRARGWAGQGRGPAVCEGARCPLPPHCAPHRTGEELLQEVKHVVPHQLLVVHAVARVLQPRGGGRRAASPAAAQAYRYISYIIYGLGAWAALAHLERDRARRRMGPAERNPQERVNAGNL